jgi:hypothetical protein
MVQKVLSVYVTHCYILHADIYSHAVAKAFQKPSALFNAESKIRSLARAMQRTKRKCPGQYRISNPLSQRILTYFCVICRRLQWLDSAASNATNVMKWWIGNVGKAKSSWPIEGTIPPSAQSRCHSQDSNQVPPECNWGELSPETNCLALGHTHSLSVYRI